MFWGFIKKPDCEGRWKTKVAVEGWSISPRISSAALQVGLSDRQPPQLTLKGQRKRMERGQFRLWIEVPARQ